MKSTRTIVLITLLAVVGMALAGCTAGPRAPSAVEPTMTAIPLPTYTPTAAVAQAETSSPTPRPLTATPLPTATATPQVTVTTEPTATSLPPTPTAEPTATATSTATARPRAASPQPTATPEFSGKLLFQTTIGGDFYVVNADGADSSDGLRRITDGVDPVWSPSGDRIAFTRWREPRGVWLVDADGSNERRVFDWSQARWPSWSPDGTEILFSRQHGGRLEEAERCFWGFCFDVPARPHWRLGIVEADGGVFYEPASALVSLAPDWSPDGKKIVYDGERGLVVQTLDGEVSYPITSDGRDTGPVWSPAPLEGGTGGTQVAFTRRQHDHWEVYVVDADGGNLTRLTDTPQRPDGAPGNSAAPAWSPSGEHLAFLTDRAASTTAGVEWGIWVMAADGSDPRPIFAPGTGLDGLALEYSSLGERALSWTW